LEETQQSLQQEETIANAPKLLENQLLATKFFAPVTASTLISRPRLTASLQQSLKYPLTLISAPAGFGKTTLLSAWGQSLPATAPKLAWVSLDEEDNEPVLFWTYVVTALNMLQPDRFTSLLMQLQSPQPPPTKYIAMALINALVEGTEHFLLILDDYHLITEQQVHASLSYLIEHLPIQLHIILSTRTDPPLQLSQLRIRHQLLEVRTDQLRCTAEETKTLFKEAMDIQLPDETIQEVTTRTEGWLVGLHLLGLSLEKQTNPLTFVQEISGDQRYILDYLTEEVLRRQPQDVQTFLLSTCILEHLTASLCDAVMQTSGSYQMLQRLEQANLFVVCLDSRRQWYRYHALFAEALHYQLEQTRADLIPILHHRASIWYAEHEQTTQAILHALRTRQWLWVADLIERTPSLLSYTWGASGEYELILLRQWLEQLPAEVMGSRPRLCLVCVQLLWTVAPYSILQAWLDAAEAIQTASLKAQMPQALLDPQERQKQENLLGEIIALRAYLLGFHGEPSTLSLCLHALALLSADNYLSRALIAWVQHTVYFSSSANDAEAAIQSGLQGISLAQASGKNGIMFPALCIAARYMVKLGRLHEALHLTQQATQLGTKQGELALPEVGWPTLVQAEILREWNELNAAHALIEEAIELCKQSKTVASIVYVYLGYAVLLRVSLSRCDLETARSALLQLERIARSMNQPCYLHYWSLFTTIDQVRLWLACGELDRAIRWVKELDITERNGTPFTHEREEVARVRILLATDEPKVALQRLEPILVRATTGQRWGHVIEMQLLQALAYQMCQEETKALVALSEAVRLAEPEGYIRCFVDEGASMETLLYHLRKRDGKQGPTPYLDTLLAAFQQESTAHIPKKEQTKAQALPNPLSERELQVLQLLAQGASNQEIAQELVIAIDTVKRHVSHIFSKLGVQNRVQAVRQAQALGLAR
jgi:LuxR family maltose regulon positive regulatory protein